MIPTSAPTQDGRSGISQTEVSTASVVYQASMVTGTRALVKMPSDNARTAPLFQMDPPLVFKTTTEMALSMPAEFKSLHFQQQLQLRLQLATSFTTDGLSRLPTRLDVLKDHPSAATVDPAVQLASTAVLLLVTPKSQSAVQQTTRTVVVMLKVFGHRCALTPPGLFGT